MGEETSTRLRVTVAALGLMSLLTFLSGFLQDTPYNFVNYVCFSLLLMGGVSLMRATVKSKQTRTARGFLFLTGGSTTALFVFYVGYEWARLGGDQNTEAAIEGFLYLLSLCFLVGAAGSLVSIRRRS